MSTLPELKVTVFSDYICPFCYVGHHRLMRLQDSYDLKINWCFVEIHPESSAEGEPVTSLQYPSDYWIELMANLNRVADEEHIPLAEHTFTTNSKDALMLSEYCKRLGRDTFYKLHESLFSAFFVHNKNIGDRSVLREIANNCNISDSIIDESWEDEATGQRIINNLNSARQYAIKAVPSFVFGERILTGVVSEKAMRDAAEELVSTCAG